MHLQESGEMYLETILVLSRRLNKVRSVDVAEEMGYSKPSVSRAVGILKKNGYIIMDGSGHLYLTDEGRSVAEKTFERHRVLTKVFTKLGVSAGIAALGKSVKYFKNRIGINLFIAGQFAEKSNDLCDNSLIHLAVAFDNNADKLLNGIGSSAYINIGKSDTAEYVADSAAACSSVFSKSREAE